MTIRPAFFAALLLASVPQANAASPLSVRTLGVAGGDGATVVSYALTNRAPFSIDFVRVACDLRGRSKDIIDEAVDIQDDVGAGETVTGDVEFNGAEAARGRHFTCRVDAAYRNK